jgi:chorismate mutase
MAIKNNRTKTIEYAWLHLTITPELKAALKARALKERKTQTALVIEALEQYLAEGKS